MFRVLILTSSLEARKNTFGSRKVGRDFEA